MTDARTGISPRNRCPLCCAKLDAATGVAGEARPVAGDPTICAECTCLLEFYGPPDALKVRPMSREDFRRLPPETRRLLLHASAVTRAFQAARKRN